MARLILAVSILIYLAAMATAALQKRKPAALGCACAVITAVVWVASQG